MNKQPSTPSSPPSYLAPLHKFIASGCYSGYSPFVSGTTGSLACILAWYLITALGLPTSGIPYFAFLIIFFILTLISLKTHIQDFLALNPQTPLAKVDPRHVVIDEWIGMLIALYGVRPHDFLAVFAAFFLFRFFDILKPGPVRWVEKIHLHWGIMLDDVGAGILASVVLQGYFTLRGM